MSQTANTVNAQSEHARPKILNFLASTPVKASSKPPSVLQPKVIPKVKAPWVHVTSARRKIPYNRRSSTLGDTIPHKQPPPNFDIEVYDNDSFPRLFYPQSGSLKSPLDREVLLGPIGSKVRRTPTTLSQHAKRPKVVDTVTPQEKYDVVNSMLSEDSSRQVDPKKMEVALKDLQVVIDTENEKNDAATSDLEDNTPLFDGKIVEDGKRDGLRNIINHDIGLLKNCHGKNQGSSSTNVLDPTFQKLLSDAIDKLEVQNKDNVAQRADPISTSDGTKPPEENEKNIDPDPPDNTIAQTVDNVNDKDSPPSLSVDDAAQSSASISIDEGDVMNKTVEGLFKSTDVESVD